MFAFLIAVIEAESLGAARIIRMYLKMYWLASALKSRL